MLWLRTQKIVSRDFRIGVAGPDSGAPRAVNKEEDLEEQDASRSGFRVSAESSGIMTRVPAQRAPQKAPLSHAVRFAGPFALSDVHFSGCLTPSRAAAVALPVGAREGEVPCNFLIESGAHHEPQRCGPARVRQLARRLPPRTLAQRRPFRLAPRG